MLNVTHLDVRGRQIKGGCKRSVSVLPKFPIALSEKLPESNRFLPNLGAIAPLPPRLLRLWLHIHAHTPFLLRALSDITVYDFLSLSLFSTMNIEVETFWVQYIITIISNRTPEANKGKGQLSPIGYQASPFLMTTKFACHNKGANVGVCGDVTPPIISKPGPVMAPQMNLWPRSHQTETARNEKEQTKLVQYTKEF